MRNPAPKPLEIRATWDPDARVWVAESDDVPGLITEAESCEALIEKLRHLIPELLEANGIAPTREVPFHLLSERTETACTGH